ncbi:MAG: hotdog fold thioesterase [Solirubrobacterales bacterium]
MIQVRLFAVLRERAASDSVEVELDEGATVRDAIEAVGRTPGLSDPISRLKVVMAVNREYAQMDVVLRDGDELALIPPVSGGADEVATTERTGPFWDAVEGRAPPPPCARLLGWTPLEVEPGFTRIAFEAKPEFLNPIGVVQGGFLAAMLDDTMGPAAVAQRDGNVFTPTLELKVSFLRPVRAGRLIAEGRVLHMGRSVAFLAGSLIDGEDEVVATATATSRIVPMERAKARAEHADGGRPTTRGPRDGEVDPDFIELVSSKVGEISDATRVLGSWPLGASPGSARVEFHARGEFLNPAGAVQGGFLAAMLDDTMGPAALTLLDSGQIVPTLELKTSFLRPVGPGLLIGEARVVHKGRSVVFTEATLTDAHGVIVAHATGTARIVPFKEAPPQ